MLVHRSSVKTVKPLVNQGVRERRLSASLIEQATKGLVAHGR